MLFSLARSCRTSCFGICPTNCPPTSFSIKPASHPAFSAGEPFSTSTISGPSFHWRTAPPRHKESSGMEVAWQASFASFLTASKKLLRVEPGMGITPASPDSQRHRFAQLPLQWSQSGTEELEAQLARSPVDADGTGASEFCKYGCTHGSWRRNPGWPPKDTGTQCDSYRLITARVIKVGSYSQLCGWK